MRSHLQTVLAEKAVTVLIPNKPGEGGGDNTTPEVPDSGGSESGGSEGSEDGGDTGDQSTRSVVLIDKEITGELPTNISINYKDDVDKLPSGIDILFEENGSTLCQLHAPQTYKASRDAGISSYKVSIVNIPEGMTDQEAMDIVFGNPIKYEITDSRSGSMIYISYQTK